MTTEQWIDWLKARIGEAEAARRDGHHEVATVTCDSAPRWGRRLSSAPGGGVISALTLDDLWALLGRAHRRQDAADLAKELAG